MLVVVVVVVVDVAVVDVVVVVVDVIVVVVEIVVVENVTIVVLVVVNSLCYLSSFSFFYCSVYPFSSWQGGYDNNCDILCFFSW